MIQPIRPQDASGIYRQVGGAGAGNAGAAGASAAAREARTGAMPPASRTASTSRGRRTDQVHISDEARQLRNATLEVQQAPDVRVDRVAALRAQIADGTYQIDAEAIAQRIAQAFGGGLTA